MPLTIVQPLGRHPTFAEVQKLAGQHGVQIHGNELAGDFYHPNSEKPKVAGQYTVGPDGELHGDFHTNILGRLAGEFILAEGKAEVSITEKPFLLPEAVLKSTLSAALKEFSAKLENLES